VRLGPWLWLILAGTTEIVFAVLVKSSDGFSRPIPVALIVVTMAASIFFMSRSMQHLPMSTVYAVWTGIGAAGALVWGILVDGEPASIWRIAGILLILAGIAGVRLAS
jgi:quaternary ammonium compound-resistance protein SugE